MQRGRCRKASLHQEPLLRGRLLLSSSLSTVRRYRAYPLSTALTQCECRNCAGVSLDCVCVASPDVGTCRSNGDGRICHDQISRALYAARRRCDGRTGYGNQNATRLTASARRSNITLRLNHIGTRSNMCAGERGASGAVRQTQGSCTRLRPRFISAPLRTE